MKRSAQKSKILSLVSTEARASDSATEAKAAKLKESFDSWFSSVAPTLLRWGPPEDRPSVAERSRRSLTSTDITRVNRATVRESIDHRLWPPEVVISFLAADVIKRKQR